MVACPTTGNPRDSFIERTTVMDRGIAMFPLPTGAILWTGGVTKKKKKYPIDGCCVQPPPPPSLRLSEALVSGWKLRFRTGRAPLPSAVLVLAH